MAMTRDQNRKAGVSPAITIAMLLLAATLFGWLFAPANFVQQGFWLRIAIVVALLNGLAFSLDGSHAPRLRADIRSRPALKAALGLVSAIALYFVFLAGNLLSRHFLPFAGANIASIYAQKETADILQIVLLLTLVIGPGEEVFWRAFLQRNMGHHMGKTGGMLITALLYGAVHAISGNLMLVVAALVAGFFWGWMYKRFESPFANMVSHTAWDLLVFVLLPFGA